MESNTMEVSRISLLGCLLGDKPLTVSIAVASEASFTIVTIVISIIVAKVH